MGGTHCWVTTLDHEVGNDAVEHGACKSGSYVSGRSIDIKEIAESGCTVVVASVGEFDKVAAGLRGMLVVQLEGDLAHARLESDSFRHCFLWC